MNILLVSPQTPMTFWSPSMRFVSYRSELPFRRWACLRLRRCCPARGTCAWSIWTSRGCAMPTCWADYVLIGAMIIHKQSIQEEIIPRCKRLGRTIIGGGPLFTTGYEDYVGDVHAVCGECEEIIGDVIRDMESGDLKDKYESPHGFPDVTKTPVPRWDLIALRHYATMPIQFSRGCPFDCEFCDIIIMNGRKPRTKAPDQMIAELDSLHAAGWKARSSSSTTISSATRSS